MEISHRTEMKKKKPSWKSSEAQKTDDESGIY